MKKCLILLLSGLLLTTSVLGSELEIIPLKHRSAAELLPVIRPLLGNNEMVSGMDYQLILRASPRSIAQIKHLLIGIDTVPRRLKISVMQNVDSVTVARLLQLSGRIAIARNARITLPGGAGQDALKAEIISTRTLDDNKHIQQVQVLEGNRARIKRVQSIPVQQQWGEQTINTTQELVNGFYVLPRVNGDKVTLVISAQNAALLPNQNAGGYPASQRQQTSSTVMGYLGSWINVSGVDRQESADSSSISTRSTSRLDEQRNMLIKVDVLK